MKYNYGEFRKYSQALAPQLSQEDIFAAFMLAGSQGKKKLHKDMRSLRMAYWLHKIFSPVWRFCAYLERMATQGK